MKRKLFLMAAPIIFGATCTFGQQRMTLYEEFTGENCPPCASSNPGLWSKAVSNESKMLLLKYQSPIPTAGPIYNQYTVDDQNRTSYYSVPFAPYGRYDGKILGVGQTNPGHVAYLTQTEIDNESVITSPFSLIVAAHYNTTNDSIIATVNIKAITAFAPAGGTLKLRAALVQTINYTGSAGTNGEKDFENVVRRMYPDGNGTAVSNSWTANQTQTLTIKGAIPTYFNNPTQGFSGSNVGTTKDVFVAVWIQNDADKSIQQAARSGIMFKTAVENFASISDLAIYPNPAANNIYINGTLNAPSETTVIITNTVGQVMSEKVFPANNTMFSENISLNNLSNGIYFMTIVNNGEKLTKRFVVSK